MPPSIYNLADDIDAAATNVAGAAREFKNYPTVKTFARVLAEFASLATIIKAYKRPMREWLAVKDEKAKR